MHNEPSANPKIIRFPFELSGCYSNIKGRGGEWEGKLVLVAPIL